MSRPQLAALHAILFAAPRPMNESELADLLNCSVGEIQNAVGELRTRLLNDEVSGIQLERVANGFRLATKPQLGQYIERVTEVVKSGALSNAALETLAIIAYRQPITRVEVETIRGVRSDSAVNALLERGLIEEQGRKDAPGRPVLFGTTADFLLHFGLNAIADLPPLPPPHDGPVRLPI